MTVSGYYYNYISVYIISCKLYYIKTLLLLFLNSYILTL